MTAHRNGRQFGALCERAQFGGVEGGIDRDGTIVQGDCIPVEQPSRCREERTGKCVPLEIDDDHAAARHFVHGTKQVHHGFILEVVQEQVTHHQIETAGTKRETERISDQSGRYGIAQVAEALIE